MKHFLTSKQTKHKKHTHNKTQITDRRYVRSGKTVTLVVHVPQNDRQSDVVISPIEKDSHRHAHKHIASTPGEHANIKKKQRYMR